MPTLETYNGYPLWHYIPNRPAAIVFAVLFVIATLYHVFAMFRHRLWFCIPFVIGGIFEIVGYVGRIIAYDETGKLIPYILQSIFLLLAPVLFAASLYMTLGRTILHTIHSNAASSAANVSNSLSFIPLRWITRIFVTADIVSFFIQGAGGGLLTQSDTDSKTKTGQGIIVGGLVFQLVAFAVFITAVAVFDVRCRRLSIRPARFILPMLYVTSLLVMLRNLMRVVEYAMGQDGYLLLHEWPIYTLDGVPMLIVMAVFAAGYPSKLKQGVKSEAGGSQADSCEVEMGMRGTQRR
ncbi:hypothetical protein SCUCBS95973_001521 [Sporothrix curviconia]|uniref:RTA1 domain protein n=1 Tax=Sporothrix curviconia TaxID=1260050 RepID=A0ABP0AZ98_9PEZI